MDFVIKNKRTQKIFGELFLLGTNYTNCLRPKLRLETTLDRRSALIVRTILINRRLRKRIQCYTDGELRRECTVHVRAFGRSLHQRSAESNHTISQLVRRPTRTLNRRAGLMAGPTVHAFQITLELSAYIATSTGTQR